jgi:hypothetical protein
LFDSDEPSMLETSFPTGGAGTAQHSQRSVLHASAFNECSNYRKGCQ